MAFRQKSQNAALRDTASWTLSIREYWNGLSPTKMNQIELQETKIVEGRSFFMMLPFHIIQLWSRNIVQQK